jgi:LPS-assembly lipoprotein
VAFRVHDGKGKEWLARDEVVLQRDLSYDDTQILAKEAEAVLLFKDMQNDAVLQVLRRVQAVRPATTFDAT